MKNLAHSAAFHSAVESAPVKPGIKQILDAGRITELNNRLRRSPSGGTLVLTAGVIALGCERQQIILDAVAPSDRFDAHNDPPAEHDFGALEAAGARVFFRIDYLHRLHRCASLDPAGASVTRRVLTVMLAEEY